MTRLILATLFCIYLKAIGLGQSVTGAPNTTLSMSSRFKPSSVVNMSGKSWKSPIVLFRDRDEETTATGFLVSYNLPSGGKEYFFVPNMHSIGPWNPRDRFEPSSLLALYLFDSEGHMFLEHLELYNKDGSLSDNLIYDSDQAIDLALIHLPNFHSYLTDNDIIVESLDTSQLINCESFNDIPGNDSVVVVCFPPGKLKSTAGYPGIIKSNFFSKPSEDFCEPFTFRDVNSNKFEHYICGKIFTICGDGLEKGNSGSLVCINAPQSDLENWTIDDYQVIGICSMVFENDRQKKAIVFCSSYVKKLIRQFIHRHD
jgi:hypothetical protein